MDRVSQVPNIRTILRSGYYIGKLLIAGVHGLVYLRWRIWRAKHAFKKELTSRGVPKDVANTLTLKYNAQNKQLIPSLLSPQTSVGAKKPKSALTDGK
jgi:hypothetical protein